MAALVDFDIRDDVTLSVEQTHDDDEWTVTLEDDGITVRMTGTADALARTLAEIQNKLGAERLIASAGLDG